MSFLGEILNGAIKPEQISAAIAPLLKDAEGAIAEGVSTAIHSGIDRLNGAKITITVEFPPAKAIPIEP